MKAILRGGAGLLCLLLAGSSSFGYYFVSPVFKQPYPQAPDLRNSGGYYLMDSWGRVYGPYYYLVPPCQPFNGILPGPTGQAIMSGNLPHTLLLSKQGLAIGNVPMVGQKHGAGHGQEAGPGPETGGQPGAYLNMGGGNALGYPAAPMPNMQVPYGQMPAMPPMANPAPYMQMPYGGGPVPYPMPIPYPVPAPYSIQPPSGVMQPMPRLVPPQPRGPIAYYPTGMGNYAPYYDPRMRVAQAQNVAPQPFTTIPGFGIPSAPMPPTMPTPPMPPGMGMPGNPGMPNGGNNGFQTFQPANPLFPLQPLQPMQPPMSQMQPMQLPRMDYVPPPQPKLGGGAYPTHPFVRSPRDFFMWGENMEDLERMRRQPNLVP